jgi:hypothetical protein
MIFDNQKPEPGVPFFMLANRTGRSHVHCGQVECLRLAVRPKARIVSGGGFHRYRLCSSSHGTRLAVVSGLLTAMIQRFAHVCLRKLGSISIDGGVASLMNTGRSVCDLNRHTSSLFNTHSLIKSATIIGGFD